MMGTSKPKTIGLQHRPGQHHQLPEKLDGLWVSRGKNHVFVCISLRA